MSTAAAAEENKIPGRTPPPRRACFSFAAYAKAVLAHLRDSGIAIDGGLSDTELSAVESAHGFDFPPDLRSILCEGLPVGPGFPNWRCASPEQLRILLSLPAAGILHEVSNGRFWPRSWGPRPRTAAETVSAARGNMDRAPALVPFYRYFYMPAAPNIAGNPVFYVRGGEVRLAGFDLADFFRREEVHAGLPAAMGVPAPSWVAKTARRVDVWTELAEEPPRDRAAPEAEMDRWLEEEMGWRLRAGGWSEEEVREIMAAAGSDGQEDERFVDRTALVLLRGGWSAGDVAEAMGTELGPIRAEEGEKGRSHGRPKGRGTWHADPAYIYIEF